MASLRKGLEEALFYGSKDQIIDAAIVKGCIEDFLFEQVRTEDSPYMSTLRHKVADSIATATAAGLNELQGRIRHTPDGDQKNELADRQIFIITEAVCHLLLKAKLGLERETLKKLLETE